MFHSISGCFHTNKWLPKFHTKFRTPVPALRPPYLGLSPKNNCSDPFPFSESLLGCALYLVYMYAYFFNCLVYVVHILMILYHLAEYRKVSLQEMNLYPGYWLDSWCNAVRILRVSISSVSSAFSIFQKFRYCRYCIMQIFRCCKYLYIAQTPCQAPFNLSWNPLEEMLPLTACTDWSKSKFCRNIKSDLYDTGWSNYCRWWDWQLCPKYIFLSQTCKQPTMRVFWWREIWDLLWKQILWNSQKWHFRCPKQRYKTTFMSPQLVGNMASETSESGLFTLGLVREKKVFCFSSFFNDRFWNFVF